MSAFDAVVGCGSGLMAIRAAFLDVFRPFHTLRDLGTVAFRWALLVMCLVAGVIAVSTRFPDTALTQAIMTAWTCVRSVEVGMALFLLILARYMGVNWRQHSFGIALGFATLAVVELAPGRILGGLSPGRRFGEPGQCVDLHRCATHLAEIHIEESGPRSCASAATASAMGAKFDRYSSSLASGFFGPGFRGDDRL